MFPSLPGVQRGAVQDGGKGAANPEGLRAFAVWGGGVLTMSETSGPLIRLPAFLGGLLLFLVLELLAPYRPVSVSKVRRWTINLTLAALNSAVLSLLLAPAVLQATTYVTARRLGVMNVVEVSPWVKISVTVVLMDCALYAWHLLNHRLPFLWRFHRVHHSDLNMDVSTATRFHIGELVMSGVVKIVLVFLLGADRSGVLIFESLLLFCAQFQHSSLKLPEWFETYFWTLFVPPSMHRIHHSVIIRERDTNYGTILSLWDRVFGTLLAQADQGRIRIGLGAYQIADKLSLPRLMLMPFTRPVR